MRDQKTTSWALWQKPHSIRELQDVQEDLEGRKMIAELFLSCALALPVNSKVSEVKQFKAYLEKYAPGYEFRFSYKNEPLGWERVAIDYRGYKTFRRRAA